MKKFSIFIFSAFLLNLVWENSQAVLYQPHGDVWGTFWRCAQASLGDMVIIGALYLGISLLFKSFVWFEEMNTRKWLALEVFSFVFAVAVEWWGVATDRWVYTAMMPIIPLINVGVAPVAQMLLLNPLLLLLARWISGGRLGRVSAHFTKS